MFQAVPPPIIRSTCTHSLRTVNCKALENKSNSIYLYLGDRGSTVVKVLCYKSEGRWFDPSWCQWIFH